MHQVARQNILLASQHFCEQSYSASEAHRCERVATQVLHVDEVVEEESAVWGEVRERTGARVTQAQLVETSQDRLVKTPVPSTHLATRACEEATAAGDYETWTGTGPLQLCSDFSLRPRLTVSSGGMRTKLREGTVVRRCSQSCLVRCSSTAAVRERAWQGLASAQVYSTRMLGSWRHRQDCRVCSTREAAVGLLTPKLRVALRPGALDAASPRFRSKCLTRLRSKMTSISTWLTGARLLRTHWLLDCNPAYTCGVRGRRRSRCFSDVA